MKAQRPALDVYQTVTDSIIAAIENGAGKWEMPWHHKHGGVLKARPMSVDGRFYKGINVAILWGTAIQKGYQSNVWGTYPAWQKQNAQVRKGEKSTVVVFYNMKTKTDPNTGEEKTFFMIGYRTVFNADQVEGYVAPAAPDPLPLTQRIEQADKFFQSIPATVVHGGNRACYVPSMDEIHLPEFDQFRAPEDYYSTRGHETVHWTAGHQDRSPRDLSGRFGDEAYAGEELVAELGAAFLCAELGIANEPRPDHAAYIKGWLKALRNDKKAIFTAASKAQHAVDYLLRVSGSKAEADQTDQNEAEDSFQMAA
jgi:antirestriction protein ArdC